MCRLLGYLGSSIQLDRILLKPEHSLVVQSYQPQEMTAGLLNADGFGIGWYGENLSSDRQPYTYRNVLPIWNDANLPQLGRYIKSSCYLGYVRSATSNLSVDIINCQPFSHQNLLFVHNGFIDDFRKTLYRPIRNELDDFAYQRIEGTTDSEHIFALIVNEFEINHEISLQEALGNTIKRLIKLAETDKIAFSANIILSNGRELAASRYSNREASPTLYYIRDHSLSDGVIIASEPMFEANWISFPEQSLIGVGENLEVSVNSIL
jgi:ergothioneine biosynthesis protein EgtC